MAAPGGVTRQIAEQIKNDIVTGALAEGEQVMSTNQYASFYRINPATAAKGFAQLVEEGVLYKKRGIGMFVSPDAREVLRAGRRKSFFVDVVDPMVREAQAIGVPLEDVITRIGKAVRSGTDDDARQEATR